MELSQRDQPQQSLLLRVAKQINPGKNSRNGQPTQRIVRNNIMYFFCFVFFNEYVFWGVGVSHINRFNHYTDIPFLLMELVEIQVSQFTLVISYGENIHRHALLVGAEIETIPCRRQFSNIYSHFKSSFFSTQQ